MTVIIPNLAVAGYRSFGATPQYFDQFSKINIFIGQNNSGKSNVLRLIHEIFPRANELAAVGIDELAYHLPSRPPMRIGVGTRIDASNRDDQIAGKGNRRTFNRQLSEQETKFANSLVTRVLAAKANLDKTALCWSLVTLPGAAPVTAQWTDAVATLSDGDLQFLWEAFTNMRGGNRGNDWTEGTVKYLPGKISQASTALVPAIRQIGAKGSISDAFDGNGLIERLVKLQHPSVYEQADRARFQAITRFLREVIDRPDAEIDIPHDRATILIHMDGKVLPIESLGSGIHEVLILAAAATVLNQHAVCLEEPELHLNPILQRKLIRYLQNETSNQYFITTHSAALMDTPGAEVYHLRLNDGSSIVERATTDKARATVCSDLGYHPSDLLQANCIIWVEGPSDRIYLNWWLQSIDKGLVEEIHYSIMFYGGRLAAHLSYAADEQEVTDFISLRKLNQRAVILIDSDRDRPNARLNATKLRLQKEFDSGPGHAWITMGREIENYVLPDQIAEALAVTSPKRKATGTFGQYDKMLTLKSDKGSIDQAPKVEVARYVSEKSSPSLSIYDLQSQLKRLAKFIWESNPKLGPSQSAAQ